MFTKGFQALLGQDVAIETADGRLSSLGERLDSTGLAGKPIRGIHLAGDGAWSTVCFNEHILPLGKWETAALWKAKMFPLQEESPHKEHQETLPALVGSGHLTGSGAQPPCRKASTQMEFGVIP